MSAGGERTPRVPVCGIGASAGGVEALQQFFQALPPDLGLAYVVIVHLAPDRKSELPAILMRWTAMPVTQMGDNEQASIEPNHVYVIAPDRKLEITDALIGASPFDQPRGQRAAIDLFFRSLAERHGDGFAVVLSGTGTDGALGAKAVKGNGGVVLVQDPDEAAHGDMPRNVIATGIADVVLPVRDLARRLSELARNKQRIGPIVRAVESNQQISEDEEKSLRNVLELVKKRTGHDFSRYKRATILRRLSRRLQLTQQLTIADYWEYLRANAPEGQALFDDLLISVTAFFRDPEAWEALQKAVIGPLVERVGADEQIRAWVPGCATGEEAYTLAILFNEAFERRGIRRNLIVFASDVDEAALTVAREGFYSRAIAADLSEARLERYFRVDDDHYRVASELRDLIVFAAHSLLRDPPFSRLHLISCRNLLIYLDRELQEQVMSVFRYSCRDEAYLFLGASESAPEELFQSFDKKHRIFTTQPRAVGERPVLPEILAIPGDRLPRSPRELQAPPRSSAAEMHMAALESAAPPSILIDDRWNVVHLSPSASRFVQQSGGPLARRLTELVRPELRDEVHALLHRAASQTAPQMTAFIKVTFNGAPHRVAVLAQQRPESADGHGEILVTFVDTGEATQESPPEASETSLQVRDLREQLRQAERRIENIRDEHYLTNEDLRAANEELQSLNEEYRSTTEELETSKEELQSINEELQTVNQELKFKLEEVSRAHSDLENLMAATDVATLFLNRELKIKRFTPQLGQIFNIKTRDHDRPISDLTHILEYETLEEDASQVLRTHTSLERTTTSRLGQLFVVRLTPYRTDGGRENDGVVVSFIDVTALKHTEAALRESEQRLEAELSVTRRLHQLTMSAATAANMSDALAHILATAVELQTAHFGTVQLIDRDSGSLDVIAYHGFGAAAIPAIKVIDARPWSACSLARERRETIEVPDVLHDAAYSTIRSDLEQAGYRSVQCVPLISRTDQLVGMLSVYFQEPHTFSERDRQLSGVIGQQAADLIEIRAQQEAVERLNDDLRARTRELESSQARLSEQAAALLDQDRNREEFLAALGHELRNPLSAIVSSLGLVSASDDRSRRAVAVLQRQVTHMTRLINDLLDITRVKYGKLRLDRRPVDLTQSVQGALEAVRPQIEAKGIELRSDVPATALTVAADPERLAQILDNLLRNAVTYTDHGTITVSVRPDTTFARIAVHDTGAGLDAGDSASLFKPYQQRGGEGSTGGLGLGLAVVKALVEAHNGTVSVHSNGPGTGSEFSFTMPLSSEEAAEPGEREPIPLPAYRVLIVDDEKDVADMFGALLETLGQDVTVTYGGTQALGLVAECRPRVAFIDLAMPEMQGADLARRLRRRFSPSALTLVAMTGHGNARAETTAADFDRYLLKPVARQDLVELLIALDTGPSETT